MAVFGILVGSASGSTVMAVSVEDGLRMLRSAPAMEFGAVAAAAGMPVGDLVIEVDQLQGRGRCDRLAASAMTFPLITRSKRLRILDHRVCPPFVTLRSTWEIARARWDTAISAGDRVPGTARWTYRSVDQTTAPRVAFTTDVAAPVAALHAVEQAHCPPTIAVRLAAGDPHRTERLAAVTPHPAALAALVTSTDETTRSVAASRDDLPPALAAASRWALEQR